MNCPYCNSPAKFVDSSIVYGKSYGMIYLCSNYPKCDSFVGVHKGTENALGRMANKELREAKKLTHFYFDKLWKRKIERENCSKKKARSAGYKWLADKMGIAVEACHIGMFDIDKCLKAIEICKAIKIK